MWVSVNPKGERPETVNAAMALEGIWEPQDLNHVVLANLYNSADRLEVDIYTVSTVDHKVDNLTLCESEEIKQIKRFLV